MAKSRIMVTCVGLLFLATFGLQEVAADCPGPSISSTVLFLQNLTDPYGTGSFLNETEPTAPEQAHECQACAVTGNASTPIQSGDAGPLVIKTFMRSRLSIDYLYVGSYSSPTAKIWVKGRTDPTTDAPLPIPPGTKVKVAIYMNDTLLLKGEKLGTYTTPAGTPPNQGPAYQQFDTPLSVVAGATSIPEASLIRAEISIANATCDCYDPSVVPVSGAGTHKWRFQIPFGPKPTPKVYMTAASYNLTAGPGETATGTLNLTSYENLCQITVVLSASGDVPVTFLSNTSIFLQEPAYGDGFMKFPRFNVTVPEGTAIGTKFNVSITGTVNGGPPGSPGIIGRMRVATLNFTLTAVEPTPDPKADEPPKKMPGFEALPLLALGAALLVALRRRTLRP